MRRRGGRIGLVHRLRALPADESGAVMLETVLVFPLQLLLMMVILQVAHIYVASHVVHYAAFQAARSVAVHSGDDSAAGLTKRAHRVAWTVLSAVNNRDPRAYTLRVPGNTYAFSEHNAAGAPLSLDVAVEGSSPSSLGGDLARADAVVAVRASYYLDLVVPLGGPFVYYALDAAGNNPVRVRSTEPKYGQMMIQQVARVPKIWPH